VFLIYENELHKFYEILATYRSNLIKYRHFSFGLNFKSVESASMSLHNNKPGKLTAKAMVGSFYVDNKLKHGVK